MTQPSADSNKPLSEVDDIEQRVAQALVTVERAEHGLMPCGFNELTDEGQARYLNRAKAVLAALRGAA